MNATQTIQAAPIQTPRKGETVLIVPLSANGDTGIVTCYVRPVQVQSWGKIKGTATHSEGGQFVKFQIWTDSQTWFRTMPEVAAYARENYAALGSESIRKTLHCEESAFGYLLDGYRAAARARI